MGDSRTIREWYVLSKTDLLAELPNLDRRRFGECLNADLARPPTGRLRTLDEILRDDRKEPPPVAQLEAGPPKEQDLQWMFVHRGFYSAPHEMVIVRELPIAPHGIEKEGWADLLVFDQASKVPVIVELKQANAGDLFCSVLFEVLGHWSFYKRYFDQFRQVLHDGGWAVESEVSHPAISIAAPKKYFQETERRATSPRRVVDELKVARQMLQWLSADFNVDVTVYSISDNWLSAGPDFQMNTWST